MTRILFTVLFWVWWGNFCCYAVSFEQANQQYRAEDFKGAAESYQSIISTDGPRAAVFYNLGNSYQNLKQYGPAILAYERARLLAPRDANLLANLALARKAVGSLDEPSMNQRLRAALGWLSRDEWSWLVAGAALTFGVLTLRWGWRRLPNRTQGWYLGAGGLAIGLMLAGAVVLYLRRDEERRGIIISADAPVLLSPFEKSEVVGKCGAGKMVHLGARNGGFRYAEELGTRLAGWVADQDVTAILEQ